MTVGIEDIEYYMPQQVTTSKELADKFGFSLAFVEDKVGVRNIYTASDAELTSDLAVKAVEKLLQRHPGLENKIQVMIVCTQTPDFQLPHTAALIQKKMQLGNHLASFDLSLGCSGFVYGLSIAKSFMEANHFDCGLLICAETYSKIINENDKNTKPLFSDAASATLLTRNPILIPQRFSFGTDGNKFDCLIFDRSRPYRAAYSNYLHMDGRSIYELVAKQVPKSIRDCLDMNQIRLEDIDYFIFHQASAFLIHTLTKSLGIADPSKVIHRLDRFGNTVSSSIPIALKTIFEHLVNTPNLKLMISGFGVGISWASNILATNALENKK